MDKLTILANALTAANALTPLIATLVGELRNDHPDLTDTQIQELAMAKAKETREITAQDMQPT